MDSKKVLQKLLKIAENQQKIIMKLAQQQGLPPDSLPNSQVSVTDNSQPKPPTETPPASMKTNKPVLAPSKLLYDTLAVDPRTKGMVRHVNPPNDKSQLQVIWFPGKGTEPAWKAVQTVFQEMLQNNAGLPKTLRIIG